VGKTESLFFCEDAMTTPEAMPRADVLAAVRAAWDEATREKHGNPTIALTTVLRVLGMGEHVKVVDGRAVLVNEAARTPEMVLRAMLRAYEAAALEAEIAYMRTRPNVEAAAIVHERCKSLADDARVDIRQVVNRG
jgi:hypothetical protein